MSDVFLKPFVRWFVCTACILILLTAIFIANWPLKLALTVTDDASGKIVFAAPMQPEDSFSIRFIHSVHETPVEELFFVMPDQTMMLKRVIYETYGVGNPSGIEPGQKFRMENGKLIIDQMSRFFPVIHLRIGQVKANHQLLIGERLFPFVSWCEPGSLVQLEIKRIPLRLTWKFVSFTEGRGEDEQ